MLLSAVANKFGGSLRGDCEVRSVCTDTRSIVKGDVFVALKGPNFDGGEFLQKAIDSGASALVSEKSYADENVCIWQVDSCFDALGQIAQLYREQFSAKITAITGSAGKTTVKGMLASICQMAGETHFTQGNFNNHIGVPRTLMGLKSSHQYAVIEAGTSGLGEIKRLAKMVRPNVALVTNIMSAHVEGFGSLDAIADEKADLYDGLIDEGIAVINLDSDYANYFIERCRGKTIFSFSLKNKTFMDNTVLGEKLSVDKYGRCETRIDIQGESIVVKLKVLGEHNINNAIAAAACANAMKINANFIKSGLETFEGVPGRMQLHSSSDYTVVDDTYNANPGAMEAAIDFLSNHASSILVCGDMGELGENAANLHQRIGRYAKLKGIDSLYATGQFSIDYKKGYGEETAIFQSKTELVEQLQKNIKKGATILVKGSRSASMETVVALLVGGGNRCYFG